MENRTHRLLATLIVSVFVVLSGGCMSNDAMMKSWVGNHYNDVIASWGPPSQVLDDPPGKIMTWSAQRSFVTPGHSVTNSTGQGTLQGNTIYGQTQVQGTWQGQSQTTSTPAMVHTSTMTRTFWVDGRGIIYRWAWGRR